LSKIDNVLQFKKEFEDSVIEGSFKDVCLETKEEPTQQKKIGGTPWIPHGFFRKINEFGEIEFFGCFINGCLRGKCWKSLIGGNKPWFQ